MSTDAEREAFERHWAAMPEGKLELIDGQLIISTRKGSRFILREILKDYGPGFVLSMAPKSLWWTALLEAYDPQPRPQSVAEWRAWSDAFAYEPTVEPAGPRGTSKHRRMFDILMWSLYHLGETTGLIEGHGRDFVIRFGENGLTPDQIVIDRSCLDRFYNRYLEGPPAIAIEIVQPGSEDQDRILKRRLYEGAGVPEYWLIEPEIPEITFFRLQSDGRYQALKFDAEAVRRLIETKDDVIYDSIAVPGLSVSLLDLWTMETHPREDRWRPFLPMETPPGERVRFDARKDGIEWDAIPFRPRVDLQPVPIRFEEYASWCGEAKFERYGRGIAIDGEEGSRRVAGMLLMTFGLVEVVRLAHPREWVTFLEPGPFLPTVQEQTARAMRLAHYERHEHRPDEVYYSGDLSQPLDLWAYGDTEDECRRDLTEQLRQWILLRLARREPLPRFE
jgi:Uma2 family endonuclease